MSSTDPLKDKLSIEQFLNLTVNEEKVLAYQAKEPFATLLKQRELSSSRDKAMSIELLKPLAESIITNWKIDDIGIDLSDINYLTLASQNQYNYLYEY